MTTPGLSRLPKPDTDRVSWVWRRNDAIEKEQDAKGRVETRPWLVLSHGQTHDRDLLIGALMTRAEKGRTQMDRCVNNTPRSASSRRRNKDPEASQSFVDTQQLWTFPLERHKEVDPRIPLLPGIPTKVRDAIREYFSPIPKPRRSGLCQGRVVWVRLFARPKRPIYPPRKPLERMSDAEMATELRRRNALERSDAEDQAAIFRSLGARERTDDHILHLPALVLTSDRFLEPAVDYKRNRLFPIVTVTPLVTDAELLSAGAPYLDSPSGDRYAPLTQALLSLDHTAKDMEGHHRIDCDADNPPWLAEPGMLQTIIEEVMGFMMIDTKGSS